MTSAWSGVVELVGGVVGEAGQPDVPDRAIGEVLRDDLLCWTMTSRTIVTSNGAAVPRMIVSVTSVPFLPRILSRARVDGQAVEGRAVDRDDDVARLEPGLLAPASPRSGATMTSWQSGPEGRAVGRRARRRRASRSRRRCPRTGPTGPGGPAVLLGREVRGIRDRRAQSTMPLIAPADERLRSIVAAGVALDRSSGTYPRTAGSWSCGRPACRAARRCAGRRGSPT